MRNSITPSSGNDATLCCSVKHQFGTKSRLGTALYILLLTALGLLCLAGEIFLLCHLREMVTTPRSVIATVFLLIFLPLAALNLAHTLITCSTAYRFDVDGLHQRRFLGQEKCIPWGEFRQICRCHVRTSEKQVPWREGLFFVRHSGKPFTQSRVELADGRLGLGRRGVMFVSCSEELFAGLKACCPLPIEDLRK